MDEVGRLKDDQIGDLIKSVVHRRKKYPKKILEQRALRASNEIKNVMQAKVDLSNDIVKMELKLLREETEKLAARSRETQTKTTNIFEKLREAQRNLHEVENFFQFISDTDDMEE